MGTNFNERLSETNECRRLSWINNRTENPFTTAMLSLNINCADILGTCVAVNNRSSHFKLISKSLYFYQHIWSWKRARKILCDLIFQSPRCCHFVLTCFMTLFLIVGNSFKTHNHHLEIFLSVSLRLQKQNIVRFEISRWHFIIVFSNKCDLYPVSLLHFYGHVLQKTMQRS